MILLIFGLVLFLGIHSVRIVADGRRSRFIAARGLNAWKGVYSLISIAGFVLICIGFGQARQQAVLLWSPPRWTHDVAALLTLLAFVLVTAAYVPGNGIKARVKDPMILGVKCWAAGHLLANGTLADVVLFGSFLAWVVLDFRAARQRRRAGAEPEVGSVKRGRSLMAVVVGVLVWMLFAFHLHQWLIGVAPFPGFHGIGH
ncbi:NnrU family protein [Scleromatobacter humisilvae]|uniref:NnrU family protein n=1 Tax=Scleromatobacter humisilvae TaxID=2897159 RepID=A0A9X1YL92_9BURK|nr:NnrU family protein [Scleromatobacter humisilvae]MCK9687525.1 NnrU family protein [Scleromatobacter humisilvae]